MTRHALYLLVTRGAPGHPSFSLGCVTTRQNPSRSMRGVTKVTGRLQANLLGQKVVRIERRAPRDPASGMCVKPRDRRPCQTTAPRRVSGPGRALSRSLLCQHFRSQGAQPGSSRLHRRFTEARRRGPAGTASETLVSSRNPTAGCWVERLF